MCHGKGMDDKSPSRCGRPVPEGLKGALKPSTCRLTVNGGPHTGQHKATMTIPGWGKVTWTWKDTPPRKAPEVTLPSPWLHSRASQA